MKALRAYNLAFAGLSDGQHQRSYDLNAAFLSHFEASLLEQANVQAEVTLEKSTGLLHFEAHLQGTVRCTCDRCGEDFDLPIDGQDTLIVKLMSQMPEEGLAHDEVVYLENTVSSYNLADFLYETLMLSLPLQKIHPNDGCNPSALKFLQGEAPLKSEQDNQSMWDALKNLKD